jgi:amino acid transporter
MEDPDPDGATLDRTISLRMLVFYGLGTTVGAGVYALTGKIAGIAGVWAPLSFLTAAGLAALTALSFGELASRFPRSAGEAVYLRAGFDAPRAAQLGGLLVLLAGVTSAATLSRACVGYLRDLVPLPYLPSLTVLVIVTGAAAGWRVGRSVTLAAWLTVLEIFGILLVAGVAFVHLGDVGPVAGIADGIPPPPFWGVVSGAVLGFYAFLGFEDMVNVAEEVREPRRTMPKAIAITLIATALLYALTAFSAVLTVEPPELAGNAERDPDPTDYGVAGDVRHRRPGHRAEVLGEGEWHHPNPAARDFAAHPDRAAPGALLSPRTPGEDHVVDHLGSLRFGGLGADSGSRQEDRAGAAGPGARLGASRRGLVVRGAARSRALGVDRQFLRPYAPP